MTNGLTLSRSPLARFLLRARAALEPWVVFFAGFVRDPVMVGALVPSSPRTIARVLDKVDWATTRVFVEYGPGVGTFCRPVLERLHPEGRLIVIDTNPRFITLLRRSITDPRFTAVLGSATDVEAILAQQGAGAADHIISGLPFITLPPGVGDAILSATMRVLRPGGAFITYQYTRRSRQLIARHFPAVERDYELWNLPPCVISLGRKP